MQLSHYCDSDCTKIKPPCLRSHKPEFPSCDNSVNKFISFLFVLLNKTTELIFKNILHFLTLTF